MTVKILKYDNTNTYFVRGSGIGLLIDTGWAGTLGGFFKSIKQNEIKTSDIGYVMATHFHPDHIGIMGDLQELGITPLILDVQKDHIHGSDAIFAKNGEKFTPIREENASIISCAESREFLRKIGIDGEIVHTPGHSPDSVSLILDNGAAFVGDLPPYDVRDGYDEPTVKESWGLIMSYRPNIIYYGHVNARIF